MSIRSEPPPVHFVLVHGTFSSDQTWPTESKLTRRIAEMHGDSSISRINWGGANSNRARALGAEILRAHLCTFRQKHPKTSLFLIGHSHGGNVILQALRDQPLQYGLSGIVTLGTPFLHARKRNVRRLLRRVFGWFPLRITFLGMIWFLTWLFVWGFLSEPPVGMWGFSAGFWDGLRIVSLIGWLLPIPAVLWMAHAMPAFRPRFIKLARSILQGQRATLRGLSPPRTLIAPLFYAYDGSDEALWLLRIQNVLTRVPIFVYGLLAYGPWIALAWLLPSYVRMLATGDMQSTSSYALAMAVFVAAVVFVFIAEGLLAVWIKLVQATGWGYGGDPLGTYLWCDVFVSRIPPSTALNAKPCRLLLKRLRLVVMRHLVFYDDEAIISAVMEFVHRCLSTTHSDGEQTT